MAKTVLRLENSYDHACDASRRRPRPRSLRWPHSGNETSYAYYTPLTRRSPIGKSEVAIVGWATVLEERAEEDLLNYTSEPWDARGLVPAECVVYCGSGGSQPYQPQQMALFDFVSRSLCTILCISAVGSGCTIIEGEAQTSGKWVYLGIRTRTYTLTANLHDRQSGHHNYLLCPALLQPFVPYI